MFCGNHLKTFLSSLETLLCTGSRALWRMAAELVLTASLEISGSRMTDGSFDFSHDVLVWCVRMLWSELFCNFTHLYSIFFFFFVSCHSHFTRRRLWFRHSKACKFLIFSARDRFQIFTMFYPGCAP